MTGGQVIPNAWTDEQFLRMRNAMFASLGAWPPRLSRWERLLVYFGLMRKPVPYTHSFTPVVRTTNLVTDRDRWFDGIWVD